MKPLRLFKYRIGKESYYEKAQSKEILSEKLRKAFGATVASTVSSSVSKLEIEAFHNKKMLTNLEFDKQENLKKNQFIIHERNCLKSEIILFLKQQSSYLTAIKNEKDWKRSTKEYVLYLPKNSDIVSYALASTKNVYGPQNEINFLSAGIHQLSILPNSKKDYRDTWRFDLVLNKADYKYQSYDTAYVMLRERILSIGDFDFNKDFTALEYLDSVLCGFNHNMSNTPNTKIDTKYYDEQVLVNNKIFNYRRRITS